MGEPVVAADETKHFEASETTASGYGASRARRASGESGGVRIARYRPPEYEPLGNGSVFPNQVQFFQRSVRSEGRGSGSEFFVVFVPGNDSIAVLVAPVGVGVAVGVEKLESVLSVPLRSYHGGSGSVERREAASGAHERSVPASAEIWCRAEIPRRGYGAAVSVISKARGDRIPSRDRGRGHGAHVRAGADGRAVPIFFVVDDSSVLYDSYEPLDVVVQVLAQIHAVAHVVAKYRNLAERLQSHDQYE